MITERIDSVTEIGEDYRTLCLPAPKSVKIELTSKCNFSCQFCAHKLRENNGEMINWDFLSRVMIEMRHAGVEELGMFYIGESLLCSFLPKAIQLAKDLGFPYVFLTTNGSLLTETKAKEIMEAGLDSLKISYNHASATQYRYMTGNAPSGYERLIENIKNARKIRDENGYSTKIYASSIKYDGTQQALMEESIKRIIPYVDEHYWLPLYSFGNQATQRENEIGLKPTAGNRGRVGALRQPLPCWAVFKEGHITVDGKLSACCFDVADKWEMADLNKVSFMDGWNSAEFQALRKAHLDKDVTGTACEQCATIT